MKKKIFALVIFIFLFKINAISAVIESNHSYLKNSNMLNDFEINFSSFGDFKLYNFGFNNDLIPALKEKKINNTLNDISVNIDLKGKIDDSNMYGIKTTMNYNNEFKKENSYFLYVKNVFGRIEVGNLLSSAEDMRIGGDTMAVGSGNNFNNDFNRIIFKNVNKINLGALNTSFDGFGNFLTREGTLSSQMFGYFNRKMNFDKMDEFNYKTKINYYSPDIQGLQLFFSYMLDNKVYNKNIDTTIADPSIFVNLGDIYSYGINYINTFDNLGLGFSYINETNKSSFGDSTLLDLKVNSKIFGLNVNYFGFILSASRGMLERTKSSTSTTTNSLAKNLKTNYTSYGVSYEVSNVNISTNYYLSLSNNKTEYSSNMAVLEYKMDKNASIYAELLNFSITNKENKDKVSARMISMGLLISFY